MDTMSKLILDEMKTYQDATKVAKKLGISVKDVEAVVSPQKSESFRKLSSDGWGPQHLRKFAVARVNAERSHPWPTDLPELEKAKKDYDAGTVEMVQLRDGPWMVQYVIPRRRKIVREPYFSRILGE